MAERLKEINKKSKIGFIWNIAGKVIRQASILFVSIVLARILDVSEFGIVGLGMAFVMISQVFVDFGLVSGIIKQKEISKKIFDVVFTVSLLSSFAISGLIFFSILVYEFLYGSKQILLVIKFLAFIPIITSLGMVPLSSLTREMNFKSISIISIYSTIFGGVVGIGLAISGSGVFALVWQQICSTVLKSALLLYNSTYKPKLNFHFSSISHLLSYSVWIFLDDLFRRLFLKADTFFVATMFSTTALGYYSRAESFGSQVTTFTTESFSNVLFPAYSSVQDSIGDLSIIYYNSLRVVSFVTILISGYLFIVSEDLVITLFGQKWIPSIIIFQIFILRVFIVPINIIAVRLILIKGYSRLKFLVAWVQRVLKIAAIFIGIKYGLEIFAIAIVAALTVNAAIHIILVHYKIGFSGVKVVLIILEPIIPLLFFFIIVNAVAIPIVIQILLFIIIYHGFLYIIKNNGQLLIIQEAGKIRKKINLF